MQAGHFAVRQNKLSRTRLCAVASALFLFVIAVHPVNAQDPPVFGDEPFPEFPTDDPESPFADPPELPGFGTPQDPPQRNGFESLDDDPVTNGPQTRPTYLGLEDKTGPAAGGGPSFGDESSTGQFFPDEGSSAAPRNTTQPRAPGNGRAPFGGRPPINNRDPRQQTDPRNEFLDGNATGSGPVDATTSAGMQLTPVDVNRQVAAGVNHRSTNIEPQLLNQFQRHVMSIPFAEQKQAAHSFLRIRRRLLAQRDPIAMFQLKPELTQYPQDYCGRPILIHGLAAPLNPVQGAPSRFETTILDPVTREPLAIVDVGYDRNNSTQTLSGILATGYFFKTIQVQRDGRATHIPLIIGQQVEWLSSRIAPPVLANVKHMSRGIPETEADAFYETLRHVQLLDYKSQQELAFENRRQRIDGWLRQEEQSVRKMLQEAELYRDTDASEYASRQQDAEIYYNDRKNKHARWSEDPAKFPIFVDVFNNSDVWHGQLVTMTGHVRNVRSYPANDDYLQLGLLHELWLYTDDSQKNPAVIICSELPENFPASIDKEVIDGVTVTGFFFKKYRYAAQDATRLAPMLLAQRVDWDPTAVAAEVVVPGWFLTIAICTLLGVGGFLVMYLFKVHDQDRRFRGRLRKMRAAPLSLQIPDEVDGGDFRAAVEDQTARDQGRSIPPVRIAQTEHTTPEQTAQRIVADPQAPTPGNKPIRRNAPPDEPVATIPAVPHLNRERSVQRVKASQVTSATTQLDELTVHRVRETEPEPEPVAAESVVQLEPIPSQNVLGQTIRAVMRATPATQARTESGKSPLVVVLRNGVRFELMETTIGAARTAAELGELRNAREKGQKVAGSRITDVVSDQWGNLYVVMNGDRYLSLQEMSASAARVSSSRLKDLFERSDEIEFADFWTGDAVDRSILTRAVDAQRRA